MMTIERDDVPEDFELVRTTPVFDNETVPAGLLGAHHVAAGAWGRLCVYSGELTFVFEDSVDTSRRVGAGQQLAIPPERPHHLELDGPVTFAVQFYRAATS